MNKENLKSILSHQYDQATWIKVLREIFGATVLPKNPATIKERLSGVDQKLAKAAWELGSFSTSDDRLVGLYQIDLHDGLRIGQNKVGVRSLLREIYKYDVDAALVVFVQGDKWRLSLISEIRILGEDGHPVEQKTEPKRFTYLLGNGETVRTAVDRLDLIQDTKYDLEALIDAFSVEKLNKDFFRDYKVVFNDIERESRLTISDVETARLFTQRILNRLMFLYFIQKKGWLSFEGNNNYLRGLFDRSRANKEAFYRDRLYWVFFYGLSNHAESIEIQTNEFLTERRGKVPYLNGGLFEMEKDGLDAKDAVSISNDRFAEILRLFESYNFTVDESTPFDVEIAVDPEMLGKVFEELVTGRHESGSYYTPRNVVSFMCREALKHALAECDTPEAIAKLVDESNGKDVKNPEKILERLRKLRACDPACGSGAYLLGMLQELLHVREALFAAKEIARDAQYEWKRDIIENSIYGVDMDRFATQIASLRLWLSLAIESDEPKPLPNLKYKIGRGDSLLAPIETIGQGDLHRRSLIEQFKARKKEYTDATGYLEKREIDIAIERLRLDIARTLRHLPEPPSDAKLIAARKGVEDWRTKVADAMKRGDKFNAEKHQKGLNLLLNTISQWEAEQTVEHYDTGDIFDWSVEFAEVFEDGGFDVVLANPPYLQLQANGGRLARLYENKGFETFARTGDIYSLFYERGVQLLKENGVLSYITSNKWMRAKYGEKTRKFFAEKTSPLLIVDFGSVEVFSSATVDNNILILEKSLNDEFRFFAARTDSDFDVTKSLKNYVRENGYYLSTINQNSWVIGEKDEFDIKGRVEAQGIPLDDARWGLVISRGILTGYNEAFVIPAAAKKAIEEMARQNPNDRSSELIKPLLRGRDIKAWFPAYADLWLIHAHNGIKSRGIPAVNVKNDYPAIYDHLSQFREKLMARQDKGDDWTNLRNCVYYEEFEKPKIIYPNMTKYLPFVYDETGYFTNQKCFIITGGNLKYLTCFFNSKLFKYCFADNFPNLGEDRRELSKVYFEKIPVKQIPLAEERIFEVIVDYVVFLRTHIQKLKALGSDYKRELSISLFFEQLSDALIMELYLEEDFHSAQVSVRARLPELTGIDRNEAASWEIMKDLENKIDNFSHPVRANLSSMKSIPAVQVIYNTIRS
ncbi:MAG: TaqI-like C-terminal specificity domain-containing protein [Acidobacteriota bacterium]